MEKIYMEENKNRKRNSVNGSVILSFLVAIFAVISLVAVGFDQVSYAAPTSPTNGSFTFNTSQTAIINKNTSNGGYFYVPIYYYGDSEDNIIFCVEHNATVPGDTESITYKKTTTIDDYGLLYILSKYYGSSSLSGFSDTAKKKYADIYIAQTAIWVYLDSEHSGESLHALSTAEKAAIYSSGNIYYGVASENNGTDFSPEEVKVINAKVSELVEGAQSASKDKYLTVSFDDGSISKVDSADYYQTPSFTITPTNYGSDDTFDLNLSGIDGAFIVDENGNKVSATTGIKFSGNSKYYVRIPSDKVSETSQTLTVSATGHFSTLTGSYYTGQNDSGTTLQKVITVSGDTLNIDSSDSIEVVGTPDTGMSVTQTIYFIGLIVLLCGVGIVYANAKPVESRQ